MAVKLFRIKQFPTNLNHQGSLSITPCPQGADKLGGEIQLLKQAKINSVISLLETSDQTDLGLQEERQCCHENEIDFLLLPLKDFGLPDYDEAIQLGERVLSMIQQGKNVAVHCRAGIGRSGMISATVLILSGMDPVAALELLEKKRKRKVPDTDAQRQWIIELPNYIHSV